ncbi:DegT/DnrJ/EryC1/StrS family aminotransferase [Hypericibacter terrae]|uniref:DegT/DnrJ/EryC1/StrS family aminotransferase n=1 Tax=Hypericibacter terrae TaxID=2602015 RepID=UPI00124509B6|nr:DegT/DnrJ/EryC1/StrS family aminotransferase [Hypericibacter terrae]
MTQSLRPIPFIDLQAQRARLGRRVEERIERVLAHGAFIMGPEVGELERRLAAFAGVRHCITCANGTDGLQMALRARDIGPDDAVIVPAFTFVAAAEAVSLVGATPVFADVREEDFNLDPLSIAPAIAAARSAGLRPAGIIAVDLFGQPADYASLETIAAEQGLFLIADAAQSFGAALHGERVGRFGHVTATSFFPSKPLGCYGDGGALFTDDDELAAVMRSLRQHGQGSDRYDHQRVGLNGRLDSIQAAVLLAKLELFEQEIVARQEIAGRYDGALASHANLPRVRAGALSVWAQYTIRVADRDRVAEALKADGIPTAIHYPRPLHHQPAYAGFPIAGSGLARSEKLAGEVLSLPMHAYLDGVTQDHIVASLRRAVAGSDVGRTASGYR